MTSVTTQINDLVNTVANHTSANRHTKSLIAIATFFGNTDECWLFGSKFHRHMNALKTIEEKHEARGHIDECDNADRRDIYLDMMKKLEYTVGPVVVKRIKGAL